MTDATAKLIGLYQQTATHADDMRRRYDALMMAMVAGETVTVLGRRARFSVEWLDEPACGNADCRPPLACWTCGRPASVGDYLRMLQAEAEAKSGEVTP